MSILGPVWLNGTKAQRLERYISSSRIVHRNGDSMHGELGFPAISLSILFSPDTRGFGGHWLGLARINAQPAANSNIQHELWIEEDEEE